jgi:S1-C subfamily serine protease
VQLPAALRQQLGLGDQETGLLVVSVEENGPASKAGLFIGDIVVAFAGEAVRDPSELRDLLGPDRVGQPATLKIVRGGQPQELTLTVGERA